MKKKLPINIIILETIRANIYSEILSWKEYKIIISIIKNKNNKYGFLIPFVESP